MVRMDSVASQLPPSNDNIDAVGAWKKTGVNFDGGEKVDVGRPDFARETREDNRFSRWLFLWIL